MQQSRREMLDELLDYVGHANDSGARDTMERILNRILQKIWMRRAWSTFISPRAYEFTTAANVAEYPLPPDFGRITGIDGQIRNLTTGRYIKPSTRAALELYDPNIGTSLEQAGQPQWYELAGTSPVTTQPATTGDALEVLSDSDDDADVRVEIEGINGDDEWTQTQVTLTGSSPVDVGTWKRIDAFGKSYPESTVPTTELTSSEGRVTLQKSAGSVVLMTLQPHESSREVRTIRLYIQPDGPYTISVPYMRGIQRILRDAAPLPEHWSPAIFEGCLNAWKVQAGEGNVEPEMWPELVELVCYENAQASQQNRQRTPFR